MLRLLQSSGTGSVFNVHRLLGYRFLSAFTEAQEKLKTLTNEPNNEIKLKLYAYYKQVTVGPCTTRKPGMLDFVAKAKWDAWKTLEDMKKSEAEEEYAKLVNDLVSKEGGGEKVEEGQDLLMTTKDGVLSIALNRPKKLNSLTLQMYRDITSALARAGSDDAVQVCTLTAHGDYYSSGNDLNSFMNVTPGGVEGVAREGEEILRAFVDSFIKFPKPLVAIVNGPAFGIMVTTLALADLVFSSDKATFYTPFAETAQSPEGCSSLLFPMIMGPAKASEVLLLSRKLTAKEAFDRNLVTAVYPHDQFREEADKCVQKLVASPPNAMSASKQIIREAMIPVLLEVNRRECEVLRNRWTSPEFVNAMMKFINRKK